MTLAEQIQKDTIAAMKERDADRVAVLRMVSSAIKNEAIKVGGLGTVLTDPQTLAVLNREVKQRKDAATQYKEAGRPELAEKEEAELAIIEEYMPKGLSDEALQSLVNEIITETGATTRADMGKVMAAIKAKLENPADSAKAAQLVGQKLQ
ncbi:MAG TPA: GatB/YqeY domain-containing protein [Patescibacteria group bacterium]